MDALVASFVAAFLGEWGDKTQLLVAALAARTQRPGLAFAGVALGAIASSFMFASAGGSLAPMMSPRATGLFLAIALVLAGLTGLVKRREPKTGSLRLPLILAGFIMALAAQLMDRTPFITMALAARFDAPLLAAAGASAGSLAALLPAAMLRAAFAGNAPVRAVRLTGSGLFLLAGIAMGLSALRLV